MTSVATPTLTTLLRHSTMLMMTEQKQQTRTTTSVGVSSYSKSVPSRATVKKSSSSSRRTFMTTGGAKVLAFGMAMDLFLVNPITMPSQQAFAAAAAEDEGQEDGGAASMTSTTTNKKNDASHEGRPYAPLEALVPITRCKIWFDEIYDISRSLVKAKAENNQQQDQQQRAYREILTQLDQKVLNRPKLFTGNIKPNVPRSGSVSQTSKEEFQRTRSQLSLPDQLSANLQRSGIERQWKILQDRESYLENSNELRAAFNYYTQQLNFSSKQYTLTATGAERKRLIRNDELPTLSAVVASDLDLRDLYRNEFLTSIDDIQAEIKYQLDSERNKMISVDDVLDLLEQANVALTKWFHLISSNDIQEAKEYIAATHQ